MSWLLKIMVLWTWGCRYLFEFAFVTFEHIPRSENIGSYCSSTFNFLRILLLFTLAAAPIYIPANSARGFLFLSPHQGLSLTFWTIATLKGMKRHLTMVLVFISLMTCAVQHLSMHLVAFYQRYLWYLCGGTSIQVLCPIFNFFFFFFATELFESFLCFGY